MNLMMINTISCLFLFPAMIIDVKTSNYDVDVHNDTSIDDTSSSVGLCVVSSLLSSLVAHGSILAMLSVGEYNIDNFSTLYYPILLRIIPSFLTKKLAMFNRCRYTRLVLLEELHVI